ncbi:MAG TPA: crosslink repair DNA glycosylase YcaQ family protein, partial [Nocardioidaceae bacterium]|nr:crosslink repair DNA glycosylase YcaQ family protein [Nocardioidaceae bacterium]
GWFAALEDELAGVRVDEADLVMLVEDLPELLEQKPADTVRLLGGFDPYILGAGTNATEVIPADHRAAVSRAGGLIAPVVLHRGRAAGTWTLEDDAVDIRLWDDVPAAPMEAEVDRVAAFLGRQLRLI